MDVSVTFFEAPGLFDSRSHREPIQTPRELISGVDRVPHLVGTHLFTQVRRLSGSGKPGVSFSFGGVV